MGIIIEYVIKSAREKKVRTFLIILAVALSGALYFASTSLSDSLVDIYTKNLRQSVGNADIIIFPTEQSPDKVVSEALALKFKEKTQYIIKAVEGTGRYKVGVKKYERINLIGMTLDDYMDINNLQLSEELRGSSFESRCIIISQKTAKRYHLNVGDQMEIYIGNVRRSIKVYGIALPIGIFFDEREGSNALVTYNNLSDYMQTQGKPQKIYIKAAESVSVQKLLSQLKKNYSQYGVEETISKQSLKDNTSMLSIPLILMTVIVTFMSIFIIYSSFTVITLEKLPVIGTFRSIGASKKIINKVLFTESLFYGITGGIIGCILGVAALYIMIEISTPDNIKKYMGVNVKISFINLLITFILSIVICLVSSMIPIFKVSKTPLKEIILGSTNNKQKSKMRKDVLGVVLIITAFILPIFTPKTTALVFSGISILFIMAGAINLLPTFVKCTSKFAESIFYKCFGNIGMLAVKNIKGNKSSLNSISLITIGVATLLMINNISINVNTEVIHFFRKSSTWDMEFTMDKMDKSIVKSLQRNSNVESIYPLITVYKTKVKELEEDIGCIESVQDKSFLKYTHYDYMGNEDQIFNQIRNGRYIVTTVIMKNRYNLKEGDKLTLDFRNGERVYTIIGFVNTSRRMGSYALIADNYLKMDSGSKYYNNAYAKIKGDPKEVLETLKNQYVDRYFEGETLEEVLKSNEESNGQLMSMLIGFSILALLIASVGIINNLMINFIERKQSIAVLRSLGMSKKQVIQMVFAEAFYSGSIGGITGITGGIIVMQVIPYVLDAMRVPMPTYVISEILWIYLIGSIAVSVLASVSPAAKSSKFNILEAIKYE